MRTDNLRCPHSLCGHAQVITDITEGMGKGMADFIAKEVLTVSDYDLYCHYVAGLVGIGLSQVRCPSLQAPQAAHCVAVYKGFNLLSCGNACLTHNGSSQSMHA